MPDGMATTKPRKSKLVAVAPKAAEPSRPKMLIYGKEGIGKSYFAAQFPRPYFIDTEGGANRAQYTALLDAAGGAYMGPAQGSCDFETVIEQVMALAQERHPYKTLVVDSITRLFNTAIANEAERLGDKDAFGASKKPATQFMRRLINWLMRIDCSVILTAHQVDVWGLNDKGQREVIGVGPDVWPKLPYELDLTINVLKVGPRRIGKIGKSRLVDFPETNTFDFTYEVFAGMYGEEIIDAESKPLDLATDEQVAEIKRLLDLVKLPDGQAEKWLAAASAELWSEVEADKAVKVIAALKAKLAV
jgi:hypothetical protein